MQTLDNIGLTAEQIAKRTQSIGGSDANTIMTREPEWVHELWLKKTAQKPADDLSGHLPVMMGQWTEQLNRLWFEKTVGGSVVQDGREFTHPDAPWRTCTVDGVISGLSFLPGQAVFEAKHVSGKKSFEDVLAYYRPQLQHNMDVAGLPFAVLSVFMGTTEHRWEIVESDADYSRELLAAEEAFWQSVLDKTPPIVKAAPIVVPSRRVNMTGNNEWGAAAAEYLEYQAPAKKFEASKKALKSLTPDDATEAYANGVTAKRNKRGALTITEKKES